MNPRPLTQHERIIQTFNRHRSGDIKSLSEWCQALNSALKEGYLEMAILQEKQLLYLAYVADKKQPRVSSFDIPKKSGGHRTIEAPKKRVLWRHGTIEHKSILKTLDTVLTHLYLDRVELQDQSGNWLPDGFIPGRSIRSNALSHVGKRYLFHLDLQDFFPNISERAVFLCLQRQYGMPKTTAACIAGVTCFPGEQGKRLAQGAPTSPILSNMVTERLDRRLLGLCKKWNVQYSRYADDLTFSADRPLFKAEGTFRQKVWTIINDEGFLIHPEKTHTQSHGARKTVTGLVVNEKVNLPRHHTKRLRLLLHWLELAQSKEKRDDVLAKFNALLPHVQETNTEGSPSLDVLRHVTQGWLSLTRMVRGEDDPRYQTLLARYHALTPTDEGRSMRRKLQTQLSKLHKFGLAHLEQWTAMDNHSTSYFLELVDSILTAPDTGDADLGLKEELILRVQQYAGQGGKRSDHWVNEVYAANVESHAGSLAEEIYRPLHGWEKDALDRLKSNFQLMEYWRRRGDLTRFAMSLHIQMEALSNQAIKTIQDEDVLTPFQSFCNSIGQDEWKTLNIDLAYEENDSRWRVYRDLVLDENVTKAKQQTQFLKCLSAGPIRTKMRFAYLWGHDFDNESQYEFKRFFTGYLQLIGALRNIEGHGETLEKIDNEIRKYDSRLRKDKPTKKNFKTSHITVMTMGIMALESFISGLGNKQQG